MGTMSSVPSTAEVSQTPMLASYECTPGQTTTARFTGSFTIGRDCASDIVLADPGVSRHHASVDFEGGEWVVRDLGSRNGLLLDGKAIHRLPIYRGARIQLGAGGPFVRLTLESTVDVSREETVLVPLVPGREPPSEDQVFERYVGEGSAEEAGEHTKLVRKVIARVRERDSRLHRVVLGLTGCLLAAALGTVIYQELRLSEIKNLAVGIFYDMKTLEVKIADLQERSLRAEVASEQARLAQMHARYRRLVDTGVGKGSVFGARMSPERRLILQVARVFGECELNVPDDFAEEVERYIRKWQTSRRLPQALARLRRLGYGPRIQELLQANRLPSQFVFVALQESNFDVRAIGPATRFGFAKGMWQFIPSTASQYGLYVGQRTDEPEFDPEDERFDFYKSTDAAARYLRDIYKGEAQASGLLVLASYNWGHNRVRKLIESMPESPRERNFWNLLKRFEIPRETYDYVFMIFSAAVIAEDPQLFGFDAMDPVLSDGKAAVDRVSACVAEFLPCGVRDVIAPVLT